MTHPLAVRLATVSNSSTKEYTGAAGRVSGVSFLKSFSQPTISTSRAERTDIEVKDLLFMISCLRIRVSVFQHRLRCQQLLLSHGHCCRPALYSSGMRSVLW